MQKIAFKIFPLAYMFVSISSLPQYEIQKSIEVFSSDELDSSPEINTRFSTDDGNLLWYNSQPYHVSSVYSISPTFTYFSGSGNYETPQDNNDKITVAYVECQNNKPGKQVGHHRFPPISWTPPGHRRGHSSHHDEQNFHGWGHHNHQLHPHQFQDYHKMFYPRGSLKQNYPNNHYLPVHQPDYFRPHSGHDLHGHHHPHGSNHPFDTSFQTHGVDANYHHPHKPNYPFDTSFHSHGTHNTVQPGHTETENSGVNKPGKQKCNEKTTPGCKGDDSGVQINPEVTTEPPAPPSSPAQPAPPCPFSKNNKIGSCFNKSPDLPSVPSSSTVSSIDYPDIDVRFGDEEPTTVSSETTTKSVA